jgi:hypothetical protein
LRAKNVYPYFRRSHSGYGIITHRAQYMKTDGHCCLNHLISLPTKDGRQYPLFDFQAFIFDIIEQNQYIWIKKSRGIGRTTFMLRYLAWKILSSIELDHKCIYIISCTSDKSTEKIDGKLKKLFEKRFPLLRLESKFTDLWLKKHGSKYYRQAISWILSFMIRHISLLMEQIIWKIKNKNY